MIELQAIDYECDGKALTGYLADGSGGRRVPVSSSRTKARG